MKAHYLVSGEGILTQPESLLTAEPLSIRIMDVKVLTKDIFYGYLLFKGEAVVFTCQVRKQKKNT